MRLRDLSCILMRTLGVAALAGVVVTGCSTAPEQTASVESRTEPTVATRPPQPATPSAAASATGLGPSTAPLAQPITPAAAVTPSAPASGLDPALTDPASPLSKRSVYFDFDVFIVRDEFRPMLEAHANYLKRNPRVRVVIEGNTDERGSREYNLALGQKRAEAVKRVLTLLGVPEAQIDTVSFGEEKPRRTGNSEADHAENRRADIRYVGE
ncbi:MAG: peptidoglycan-associated lipoprotein Pal [Casimicrobiaceae bacterium]|nr:peptidoglycan-associated lipoprotein Pal [Casimicrobiaceae bacterium]MDW8311426.1 peptidoglycan-associated lipoprotein Pal [Burkholderiales bacterium]